MFEETAERIKKARIIPVASVQAPEDALCLARALKAGGFTAVEITFRNISQKNGAEKTARCIEAVKKEFPDFLTGAGTVINAGLAKMARKAGADFIVSPGFNPKTVKWCINHRMPVFPGVFSPGEIEQALEFGLNFLKFFPAESSGGVKMIKSLAGPFPQTFFIPTGGINCGNFKEYLSCKNVGAVGGSWMCPDTLIKEKNWPEIEKLCSQIAREP
ncbi:bifunctional 4-hydroxy-2-oxoglutarate aldolase/2-dehydro-3-deoxy-phosphogluconate aldolase [Treponema sp.]|uniref:bifunctional 4-hydroxy-2-oxoglutarate aldolase/2-dehydro-3-deoxy-phosphogluconate aldolase n=1 Tax=Treponema sp. TaxID=166 RepID=UPI003F0B8CFF